ncbi:MAG: hypothetical protein HC780_08905 [Leptolyngbyaceae cyanobacterium CSU_1_3]|nr:hypothetical protein [Leptolyngbyaceae cyanobacterium CSU_1_3]
MRMFNSNKIGLIGGVFGGLILGVPVLSSPGLAALNPCPKIYYEEPYNSRLIVSQNCPPNAATQATLNNPGALRPGVGGSLPGQDRAPIRIAPSNAPTVQRPSIFNEPPYNRANPGAPITSPIQPPLPEQRSQPVARVLPSNGTINVSLKNDTNVIVTYEAVQYTQRRALRPGETVVLRNVPVPVTVTFVRQDNGFVEVLPVASSERGLLSLELEEDTQPLDSNQGTIRVQRDGQVFLN